VTVLSRLVTFVDLRVHEGPGLSFSARHEVVLRDGRRKVLLDDRGWTQSAVFFSTGDPPMQENQVDPWEGVTPKQIDESARTVVGPDEAYGDYTPADIEEAHWAYLTAILKREGIEVDATEFETLGHDVVLSYRLLASLADPV
jgi:hypothetical protein